MQVSIAYSSTLKMEEVRFFIETVNLYHVEYRCIQDESTLHGHRHENYKLLIMIVSEILVV
jgi:hypothetical protein